MSTASRPARSRVAHELKLRTVTVRAVTDLTAHLRRVTLTGAALEDFASVGPTDHIKLFLADPSTGLVHLPDGNGGVTPPGGASVRRDMTPRAFRPDSASGGPELDLDVVVHEQADTPDGPLAVWIDTVRPGDSVSFVGPRGSKLVPEGYARAVVAADETALPSVARWLELLDPTMDVLVLAEVQGPGEEAYLDGLRPGVEVRWLHRGDAAPGASSVLAEAFAELGAIDADTFVWVGGEATSLVPVRRHLRRDLGLPAAQAEVQGYWRRGVGDYDHHAPIDPSDPD
ncbi:MAG: siderophore-interacting protein [Actinomycetales bacterium]|nr:siderophore-interacting protein [Actinomycetales bacterium]